MDVSTYITSRRAMLELELDLLDRQAGADGVDRHPRLDAEAGCEREDRRARRRREVALTRERLGRLEAAAEPDQRPCDALRDPEATALPACEPRHPHALQQTVTWQEGARVAAQVGVEEQQRARRRGPLRGRQRLPLAASREPSSATITSAPGNAPRRERTVSAIASSSSRAATRIVNGSTTRDGWQDRFSRADPVRAAGRAGEQERERGPAGCEVEVVHGREPAVAERRDGRRRRARLLHPDCRDVGGCKTRVQPVQEPRRLTLLRIGGAHDDDAVGPLARVPVALRDQLVAEQFPQRRLATLLVLAAQRRAERGELVRPDVTLVLRTLREQRCVEALRVDRDLQRNNAHRQLHACIVKRSLDCALDAFVLWADEENGDALAHEQVAHYRGIRVLGALQLVDLGLCVLCGGAPGVALRLGQPQVGLVRDAAAREPDADEDADDQREEDRDQRRDVVAEVEHAYKSAAVWISACRRSSACRGSVRRKPISSGPSTVSVASVRSGAGAASFSVTWIRSRVSWNANRSYGSTAVTRSVPVMFGRRNNEGRSEPTTCQRAPGAKPRRSGCRPLIPGHQSGRWNGSARNAQTSARGASSSRDASNFGT